MLTLVQPRRRNKQLYAMLEHRLLHPVLRRLNEGERPRGSRSCTLGYTCGSVIVVSLWRMLPHMPLKHCIAVRHDAPATDVGDESLAHPIAVAWCASLGKGPA